MVQENPVRPRYEEPLGDPFPPLGIAAPETARGRGRFSEDPLCRHVDVTRVVDRLLTLLGDADDPFDLVAALGLLDARADPLRDALEDRPGPLAKEVLVSRCVRVLSKGHGDGEADVLARYMAVSASRIISSPWSGPLAQGSCSPR